MLFDAIGSLSLLSLFSANQLSHLVPGIVVWDQYVDFIEWSLDSIANFTTSGGLAIIVFTIIVKTILLPLTIKATRSSKNMQELQPKIKELQKKFGKDRQRLSQETMALYQAYGVNPLAGCLPMIIQIPIFFGVYRGISNLSGSETGEWAHGFLWLSSLEKPDPWHLLPVLAGVFQFVQTRMMRPANQGKISDPQQQIMNTMMNFMPLMVVVFGWSFDSGPVIYWVTQSVYSVVQQWFITGWGSLKDWLPWLPELPDHRRLGYVAPRNLDDVVVVSGEAKPQGGRFQQWMQSRLEEAQKRQAERQKSYDEQRKERQSSNAEVSGGAAPANRSSSSYQNRVDGATKFKAKTRSSTEQTESVNSTNGSTQKKKKKQRRPSGRA